MFDAVLVYTDIKEEETEPISWEKQTVKYCIEHERELKEIIPRYSNGLIKDAQDIADVFGNLEYYMAGIKDYNIEDAYKEETDTCISVENYVKSKLKICCKRFNYDRHKKSPSTVSLDATIRGQNSKDSEGNKTTIKDTVGSHKSDELDQMFFGLEEALEDMRHLRVKHGIDLYPLLYIWLKLPESISYTSLRSGNNIILRILIACGYPLKDALTAIRRLFTLPEIKLLGQAIDLSLREDTKLEIATSKVAKYVHCRENIDNMVRAIEESRLAWQIELDSQVNEPDMEEAAEF